MTCERSGPPGSCPRQTLRPPSPCLGRRSTPSRRSDTRRRWAWRSLSRASSSAPWRRCSMSTTLNEPVARPPWVVPAAIALTALPTFVAFWTGGNPRLGAAWAAVSLLLAAAVALGGRSDTIRLIRGDHDDERSLVLETQAHTITS